MSEPDAGATGDLDGSALDETTGDLDGSALDETIGVADDPEPCDGRPGVGDAGGPA